MELLERVFEEFGKGNGNG